MLIKNKMSILGEGKGTKAKEPEKVIIVREINKNLKYKLIKLFLGDYNKL